MLELTLNNEQYEFIVQHHETVELGMLMLEFFYQDTIIRELEKNQEYRSVFGTMVWDEMYDRYECHPNYDKSFRLKLRKQFISLRFGE